MSSSPLPSCVKLCTIMQKEPCPVFNSCENQVAFVWVWHVCCHVWTKSHALADAMGCCVQLRGSIPLYWVQDTASVSPINPKPAIQLQQYDPHYSATRLHFQVGRLGAMHVPQSALFP